MTEKFFITKDNCQLAYQFFQKSPRYRTVVFLHGLGGDLTAWLPFAEYVFQKHSINCLLIDLRGHGHSSKTIPPTTGNLSIYAADLVNLLDHLHISHPIIITHCFGGNVALAALGNYSPTAIVTFNTSPLTSKKSFRERIKPYLIYRMVYYFRFLFPPQKLPRHQYISRTIHHQDFNPIRTHDDIKRTGVKSYLFALNSFATFNPLPQMFVSTTPIIAILGRHDRLFPFSYATNGYKTFRNATVKIVDDNHMIPLNWSANKLALLISQLLTARGIHDLKT